MAPPLVPFLYPDRELRSPRRSGAGRYKEPRIPRERWPAIATRAQREGLRTVARELGVSHGTERSLVRAVARAEAVV